ncbi:kelch-like protein 29 [Gigantopelta aegis]|uniref:kelch-like protein 29 n=1 Tax=Gigantopelta aegis TaxID=1735272 RepID=UPI001B88B009|nr:kelch-like protein 29 [Gigantopelta aegis]
MAKVQLSFLRNIHELLIQGDHNDIKLVFQDGCTTGSQICLIALSPYFEAMLTSDMLEKNTGVVMLPTVSKQTFNNVLKFHFLGENVVNDANCHMLLDIAELMLLDDLKSFCMDYMHDNLTLTVKNCIYIWRLSNNYNMENLATQAFCHAVRNMGGLSKNRSIVDLTKDEYLQILSQCDLSYKEEDVVRDVQMWIQENNPSDNTMVDLFREIKFEHVSLSYLTDDIDFTSFVQEHGAVQQVVQEGTTRYHHPRRETDSFTDNRALELCLDVVFVLRGYVNVLSAASLTNKTWYQLPPAPCNPGDWCAAAVFGKCIYITGGYENKNLTLTYRVWERVWDYGPILKHQRYAHCMTVLGDSLYVIGGENSSTIEELQHGQQEWQVVGDIGCKRQNSSAEAVGENILVVGGIMYGNIIDVIHCFNTNTHALSIIDMPETTGYVTRSYRWMSDIYLVHDHGAVDLLHIDDDSRMPIPRAERVAEFDKPGRCFGFVNRGKDDIIVYSKSGIQKWNISDGSKERIKFQNRLEHGEIFDTLEMKIPPFYLGP